MDNEIHEILKRNQLSITSTRKKILELFLGNNRALAHADIEKKTGERIDRVTVYRTLQSFLDKGIIHTIPSAENTVLYALCKDNCSEGHHQDHHIHFLCKDCGTTFCLDDVNIPSVKLPNGFRSEEVSVVVSGVCRECK